MVVADGPARAQPAAAGNAAAFAAVSGEADSIERNIAFLRRYVEVQTGEISTLEGQLASLEPTAAALPGLMQQMMDQFAAFVAADLPFLPEERAQRVERLREMMAQAETPTAEKFRRLLEAYQIEAEYGRTMEAYAGTLEGKSYVQFLRLGRVALMYATADGLDAGYWDATQKTWISDPDNKANIEQAIRIAKQEVTADLVTIPLPAAQKR
ncbi:MAG: DUF3450 domain-containing protein [Rhodospirillaceae bacterium]|nr:DUF3450 domain-containing protein [Rhodospirillaceae bacterium]